GRFVERVGVRGNKTWNSSACGKMRWRPVHLSTPAISSVSGGSERRCALQLGFFSLGFFWDLGFGFGDFLFPQVPQWFSANPFSTTATTSDLPAASLRSGSVDSSSSHCPHSESAARSYRKQGMASRICHAPPYRV